MIMDMLEIQRMLRLNGILISFAGRLTQELIVEYGEAVKRYLELDNRPKNETFNIFSMFIEQTQNINNYCASRRGSPNYEQILQSSIVAIGKTEEGSFVSSGNLIEAGQIPVLSEHMARIAALDKAGLKDLYKQRLKQPPGPDSSGAGLGLIDMARKASLPLEYRIVEQADDLAFFVLKATV